MSAVDRREWWGGMVIGSKTYAVGEAEAELEAWCNVSGVEGAVVDVAERVQSVFGFVLRT